MMIEERHVKKDAMLHFRVILGCQQSRSNLLIAASTAGGVDAIPILWDISNNKKNATGQDHHPEYYSTERNRNDNRDRLSSFPRATPVRELQQNLKQATTFETDPSLDNATPKVEAAIVVLVVVTVVVLSMSSFRSFVSLWIFCDATADLLSV